MSDFGYWIDERNLSFVKFKICKLKLFDLFPNNMKHTIYILLLLITCASCTKQPKLEGIDLEKFRADYGGCKGDRTKMIEKLKSLKGEIKGVSSNDFDNYLGKPDIQQLSDRSQEYYIYFLEPGTHCEDKKKPSSSLIMAVRFSAMGVATEVNFQRGMPEE